MNFLKRWVLKWLGFYPAQPKMIRIQEAFTHKDQVLMNRIWYRGDPAELKQFYESLGHAYGNDSRFWAVVPLAGQTIRKIHTGLPSLIIDMLNDITNDDCLGVRFWDDLDERRQSALQTVWDDIAKDNNFISVQKEATRIALAEGDAAFKISIDAEVSEYPIIEVYPPDQFEPIYRRGRLFEIDFYTFYEHENATYKLVEKYGKGYIQAVLYKLDNDREIEIDLNSIPQTESMQPEVLFNGDFIMGAHLRINKSAKFPNRGKALLETKYDIFDALDEVVSQWLDAVRLGRVTKFIPDELIPRDNDGNKLLPNPIINQFLTMGTSSIVSEEGTQKGPVVTQPDIKADQYLASYIQFLDMALQGVISPSTLGIDVKKLDNAEAQREKEKTTLYTRNKIITALEKVIPRLAENVMKTYDNMLGRTPGEYKATIEFGEYANPSFEAMVETLGKAVSYRIMSIKKAVDELYGDNMTEEEKEAEVQRIKEENSFSTGDGAFGGMDFFDFGDEEEQPVETQRATDNQDEEEDS